MNSSHFLESHFNYILLSTPSGFLPSGFPTKPPTCITPLPIRSTCPTNLIFLWFDHPNNIWWGVQSIKLLSMPFSPLSCYFVPLRPKYLSNISLRSFLHVRDQVPNPCKTAGEIKVVCVFNLYICGKLADKRFCTEWLVVSYSIIL
jgi:hypothetical protein